MYSYTYIFMSNPVQNLPNYQVSYFPKWKKTRNYEIMYLYCRVHDNVMSWKYTSQAWK